MSFDYRAHKKIDWRLRPPFPSFKENKIFDGPLGDPKNPAYSPSAVNFSMDLLLKEMDEYNIQIGVVPYRATQQELQKTEIPEIKAKYPNRFKVMAHIDPYAENPVKDIDDMIVNGSADLAIIEPGQYFLKKSIPADDNLLYPIYQKCEKENIVLTITYGGLYTNSTEVHNAIFIDRVAREFPKLRMVIAHGCFPYVREIMHVCYNRKNVYISPDFYISPMHGSVAQDYAAAANYMCAGQIVFGSCYPGSNFKTSIDDHVLAGISEAALQQVFWDTPAKLLNIE